MSNKLLTFSLNISDALFLKTKQCGSFDEAVEFVKARFKVHLKDLTDMSM